MFPFASCCQNLRRSAAPIVLVCAWLLAAVVPSNLRAAAPAEDATLTERLDALFACAYSSSEPGAAVRVQRGEEVLLRNGYGVADLELSVPIEPDMVFHLCSISKQFTAVAVFMLAIDGKIDLDAPVGRYLTDYPQPGAAATVQQLLTHTSGIPGYTSDPEFWETACRDLTLDELIATWKDKPLDFAPGTDWKYSNSGYVLLGKLIEVVSGVSYPRFMEERIFTPLGLEHSAYADWARIIRGRIRGYDREGDKYLNTPYVSMSLAHAAGGLLSNVDDMVAWVAAVFNSERLISEKWRQRLLAPAVLVDGRCTFYACGFEVHSFLGHQMFIHGGGGGGFATFVAHIPDADLTVVVLSNRTDTDPSPQTLAQQAVAMALGAPLEERPRLGLSQAIAIQDESLLDALKGRYELAPGFILEVRREGSALTIQPTGQPALRIYPQSESSWFPLEIDALIEFQSFSDGRANRLVLWQNGREMQARRIE